jgi:hypothetical protein
LRSQGIPARYVTGYTSGQPAGEDTYVVRGMNAHAWVEVYFPDEGWVRFDPTPAAGRTSDERRALNEARLRNVSDVDTGETRGDPYRSPGDDRRSVRSPEEPRDSSGGDETAPLVVSVDPDPVPGREVTVAVERSDRPVPGVAVLFNGNRVGTTGGNGTVTARVPYAESLNVTVDAPSSSRVAAVPGNSPPGVVGAGGAGGSAKGSMPYAGYGGNPTPPNGSNTTSYSMPTTPDLSVESSVAGTETTLNASIEGVALGGVPVEVEGSVVGRTGEDGTVDVALPYRDRVQVRLERGSVTLDRTLNLTSEIDVGTVGDPIPGREGTLTATIAGEPVESANVTVEGDGVGWTDDEGGIPFRVPFQQRVAVTVERGELATTDRVGIAESLNLSVSGAAAGSSAKVRVTVGGEPIENATVGVGDTTTTTEQDGTARVSLGFSNSATLTASRGDLTAEKRLNGLYEPYLPYVAVSVLGIGLVVVGKRRTDPDVGVLGGALEVILAALVGVGDALEALGERVRRGVSALLDSGPSGVSWPDFGGIPSAPRGWIGGVLGGIAGWLAAVPARAKAWIGSDDAVPDPGTPPAPVGGADGGDGADPSFDVRAGWTWVERNTSVYDRRTRTPGEIAREAETEGLPREPVGDLLRSYRTVVYGERALASEDRERAREAFEAIQQAVRERRGGEE